MEMVLLGIKNSMQNPDKKKIWEEAKDPVVKYIIQLTKRRIAPEDLRCIIKEVTNSRGILMNRIKNLINEIMDENQPQIEE